MVLCRPTFLGGNLHAGRSAFERAIGEQSDPYFPGHGKNEAPTSFGDQNACSNITLWKLYILFELDQGQDIKAAKAVFYRAIRACPWSKELVMLAFERLASEDDGLGFDELRVLYNLLDEKQLRIHVDIANEVKEASADREKAEAEADEWLKDLGENMDGIEMK
jgi:hypothetical protein